MRDSIGCAHLWVFEVLPRPLTGPALVQDAAQCEDIHLHEQDRGGLQRMYMCARSCHWHVLTLQPGVVKVARGVLLNTKSSR